MSEALAFAARHSMDSPEWYTPSPFVEAARELMGSIDLDPASHEEANRTVKAAVFFSDHGQRQSWAGNVFINPPGGLVNEFWCHLIRQWAPRSTSSMEQFVWIGYSLEQLQTLQLAGARSTPLHFPICIPNRRIAFVENEAKREARIAKLLAAGKKPNQRSQPSHGNYIVYGGHQEERFMDVFSKFGEVRL